MTHPHLGYRFVEHDGWAVLAGPADGARSDPHVLVLASIERSFLEGLLVGVGGRPDCVETRIRLDPKRGIYKAEGRFSNDRGAGEVAGYLKRRGFRLQVHPVILDEDWWTPFRTGPVPEDHRWTLPLGIDPAGGGFDGHNNWPWARGQAFDADARDTLPGRKLCLASWDRARMDTVLAALTQHPRCFGVKANHPKSSDVSYLGRAIFLDDVTTGWVARQLEEQCPDVVPVVQDDTWFQRFRA